MSGSNHEFDGILLAPGGDRAVMSRPARLQASALFVREVRDALGLSEDQAPAAADWIADKMERFGARTAQPVFDMEGNGPSCSWCGTIWPLCGHHHLSDELDEPTVDEEPTAAVPAATPSAPIPEVAR